MIIEEFGPRVASVWNHLRTTTRNLVEKAWQSPGSGAAARIAQSAEVFARLIERAHQRKDYAQVDALAALLPERLAPSELCDLARASNVVVRALAQEALT